MGLKNEIVLVAGGTGELGQAVTAKFVNLGARVFATFISEAEVATFQSNFPKESKKVGLERLNALDEPKVARFLKRLAAKEGAPRVLVNLIGGYHRGPKVVDSTLATYAAMLELNFHAPLNLVRTVLPYMLGNGGGRIVNVGARAGLEGSANQAAYAIAKSAVLRLTEALSAEVKDDGVNVNCVLPSIIDTSANRQDQPGADFDRWVAPADLAEVIVFLASAASRAIHGAAIPVYGRS